MKRSLVRDLAAYIDDYFASMNLADEEKLERYLDLLACTSIESAVTQRDLLTSAGCIHEAGLDTHFSKIAAVDLPAIRSWALDRVKALHIEICEKKEAAYMTALLPSSLPKLTPEQECLLSLARIVWVKRGSAKEAGLPYNEETITEAMLLDLKLTYPGSVTIVDFNKSQEARVGADWAWAFVSADDAWSLTMLVQAKRLDDRDVNYRGIKRRIGNRKPIVRQVDRLIATAAQYGIPPIFAFYNHLDNVGRLSGRCGSIPPESPEQVEAWGISLASAHAVEPCLPDERFDTHSRHSIPLHCMLCTHGSGRPGPEGSAGSAAAGLSRILGASASRDPKLPLDLYALRQGLHPVAAAARELALAERPERREDNAQELQAKFPGIAGVLILRDAKTEMVGED